MIFMLLNLGQGMDIAADHAILKNAGGIITDLQK